jgi:hypothetical protein
MATAIWAGVVIITDGVEAEAIITTTDCQIWYPKEAASVGGLLSPQGGRFAPKGLRARKSWGYVGPVRVTIGRFEDGNRWPACQFHMGQSAKTGFARPSDLPCKNDFIGKTWAFRRK